MLKCKGECPQGMGVHFLPEYVYQSTELNEMESLETWFIATFHLYKPRLMQQRMMSAHAAKPPLLSLALSWRLR